MNLYNRTQRECDEWHIPYYGPTQEDLDEAATYGDIQYEMQAQLELDEQWEQEQSK